MNDKNATCASCGQPVHGRSTPVETILRGEILFAEIAMKRDSSVNHSEFT